MASLLARVVHDFPSAANNRLSVIDYPVRKSERGRAARFD